MNPRLTFLITCLLCFCAGSATPIRASEIERSNPSIDVDSERPVFRVENRETSDNPFRNGSIEDSEEFSETSDEVRMVSDLQSSYSHVGYLNVVFRDPSRHRSIPAKIYYPRTALRRPLPVIIFSHGLGGSPERCSYLGRTWGGRGFVTVLVQHSGSDENVWKGKIRILNELKSAYQYNWNGRTRALDIRCVLDSLQQWVDSGQEIGSMFDLEHVGVGGYDLGSLASLLVVGQAPPDHGVSLYDPRVKAVLAMSPPINPTRESYQDVYGRIDIPAFFITGTEDDGIVGTTKAYQRRIPFDSMSGNNRYLVILRGGDHQVYGGRLVSIGKSRDSGSSYQNLIAKVSAYFWLAYLKDDENALDFLKGYRINSFLGGMATIERRGFSTNKTQTTNTPPVNPSPSYEEKDPQNKSQTLVPARKTLVKNDFPITGYYRRIVQKIDVEFGVEISETGIADGTASIAPSTEISSAF